MVIHLFAPFFTGSHKAWAQGYAQSSCHEVKIFSLPGKYWKWRMHGAAVSLAQQFLDQEQQPDLILATDMLDLATFLALTRVRTAAIPTALYFHENQLTYPWSPTDEDVKLQRDRHYAWLNYTSALTADKVYYNSAYNKDSFLQALTPFLQAFPDNKGLENIAIISKKSKVLPLGLDLAALDPFEIQKENKTPVLLWNHRWEYDKDPKAFFELCYQLDAQNIDFNIVVLGEKYAKSPPIFAEAKTKLADKIIHWGYAESYAEYAQWLWRSDILPVTSRQDFFGGSVVEAMYCGVYPLLPKRLAFPEHIPTTQQNAHLYIDGNDLFKKTKYLIANHSNIQSSDFKNWVKKYDWNLIKKVYDDAFII